MAYTRPLLQDGERYLFCLIQRNTQGAKQHEGSEKNMLQMKEETKFQ